MMLLIKQKIIILLSGILFFCLTSFILMDPNRITVYLIGDSTMSIKETTSYPETGWGMPFACFFDSTVVIENHAKNGRSTKTFLSENRWSPVVKKLHKGDYVFIQFGHNDEVKTKIDRYTTPEKYESNLLKFIEDTRKEEAVPILITPVSRRKFDSLGNVMETHPVYSDIVRKIAKEQDVYLIDLDMKSQELYLQFGPENSKLLFLWLAPGEHPNYPLGKQDNTHFNELGARKVAQLVLSEIRSLDLELTKRIVKK